MATGKLYYLHSLVTVRSKSSIISHITGRPEYSVFLKMAARLKDMVATVTSLTLSITIHKVGFNLFSVVDVVEANGFETSGQELSDICLCRSDKDGGTNILNSHNVTWTFSFIRPLVFLYTNYVDFHVFSVVSN